MQIVLAEENGSSGFQETNDFRILGRDAIFHQSAAGRGPDCGGINEVLQADGNSVQWTAPLTAGNFGFRNASLGESGVGGHGDKGVELRIEPFDALQAISGEVDGRDGAIAELSGDFQKTHWRKVYREGGTRCGAGSKVL